MSLFKKISMLIAYTLPLIARPVFAIETGLNKAAENAGLKKVGETTSPTALADTIGKLIGAILAFVGILFLIMMIYGGFKWMTSRGDATEAKTAKGILTNAVIGLIIISAAYLITNFIVDKILTTAGVT